eukprot:ctg_6478.g547
MGTGRAPEEHADGAKEEPADACRRRR